MVYKIEVEGSHYEMGFQQGSQVKKIWERMYDETLKSDLVAGAVPKIIPPALVFKLLGWVSKKKLKPILLKHSPKQDDALLGLAKGLQIKKNLSYATNLIEIVTGHPRLTMKWPAAYKGLIACTQLFALSPSTADGNDYLARNYDFPNLLQEYQMVRIAKPNEGYKNITMTQVCIVGAHQGMNEKGLSVAENYGRSWKKEYDDYRLDGAPGAIIVQEVLEKCATTAEAIEFITNYPRRGNGAHFGILDKEGNACLIETTASRHAFRYPDDGILVHTNLYLTDELKEANTPKEVKWKVSKMDRPYYWSPERRYARAYELMQKMKGKLNREEIYKILSDHNNREPDDDTVCTHGETGSTLATITSIPKKLEFWVTDSRPCESQQELFKI